MSIAVNPSPLICLITSHHAVSRIPEKYNSLIADHSVLRQAPAAWQRQLLAIHLAVAAGCLIIQVREPELSARQLTEFVRAVVTLAHPHGARVLVNERLDIALVAGADGVHLRSSSFSAQEVRRVAERSGRQNFLIGASTHSLQEALLSEAAGVDFVVLGPVWSPLSKRSATVPAGLRELRRVTDTLHIPVLALGGVQMENYPQALAQGAAGIAAISLFTDPDDIEARVAQILKTK